ncbi:MAG: trypsin-like peptidase domain-containing protein [Clostridia bacterium]|nr:trypsin-like peptidase domain-containing protein [Clostridia bacterium]
MRDQNNENLFYPDNLNQGNRGYEQNPAGYAPANQYDSNRQANSQNQMNGTEQDAYRVQRPVARPVQPQNPMARQQQPMARPAQPQNPVVRQQQPMARPAQSQNPMARQQQPVARPEQPQNPIVEQNQASQKFTDESMTKPQAVQSPVEQPVNVVEPTNNETNLGSFDKNNTEATMPKSLDELQKEIDRLESEYENMFGKLPDESDTNAEPMATPSDEKPADFMGGFRNNTSEFAPQSFENKRNFDPVQHGNIQKTNFENNFNQINDSFIPENPTAPKSKKKQKAKKGKKKTSKNVLIITLIIVAICLLLVGAYFALPMLGIDVFGGFNTPSDNTNNSDVTSSFSDVIDTENSLLPPDTDVINPNSSGLDVNSQPDIGVTEYSAQYAYEVLSPSVVGISCYEKGLTLAADGAASEGTGIVVTADGYIATNSHVIGDSKTAYEVYVTLGNGNQIEAMIVGFDTKTDLAVLKIDPAGEVLKPATFADSEKIFVGQDVVAIGNPGGSAYSNSITRGIISALNRSVSTFSYVDYIQTDAAINPGNSGGPLANLYGQVIGINTIKIVDEEYEGMGFAIPSVTVKKICDDLINQGYVSGRVRIGIVGQELTSAVAASGGLDQGGIIIIEFSPDSPFNGTEAKPNDIITAFNGVTVTSFSELYKELDKYQPGDEVTVTLYRAGQGTKPGKSIEVKVKLLADLGETQSAVTDPNE